MEGTWQDLRYAARQLLKHPAFTLTAVLTLALGIGANTAIFTVVQSVLLAPLQYRDADRIVALTTRLIKTGRVTPRMTGGDIVDVRSQTSQFSAVSYYAGDEVGVQLRDHAVFTQATEVNASFARIFSLAPLAGRWFADSEANRAATVSARFALENFGSAQAALGQTIKVANQSFEIVGVVPTGFDFPSKTQVWVAAPLTPESMDRTAYNYAGAVAKLRAGASIRSAQAELQTIGERLATSYPDSNRDKSFGVVPLREQLVGKARPALLLLISAVGLILLIACVNVTQLQLARAVERQRELAVRTALGSSRWELGRLVAVESLLVSLAGGLLGILLAVPAVRVLVRLAPEGLPRVGEIHLNGWVLAFTALLCLLATVASSLLPARQAAHVDPAQALKQDASRGLVGHKATRLRGGLVVAEVAATFVLAVGAGLLVRTLLALTNADLGYRTAGLLVVDAGAQSNGLDDARKIAHEFGAITSQLSSVPGVEHVAAVNGLPAGGSGSNGFYGVSGGVAAASNGAPYADFIVASPGYFETMGIPLLQGRDFTEQDGYDAQYVTIISESVARQSFGSQDPIGRQVQCGLDTDKWMTVVGVVRDVRQDSPASAPGPTLYMPLLQHPTHATDVSLVLRTRVTPAALIDAVRARIQQADPAIALRFTTMDAMVGDSLVTQRFRTVLLGGFAAVGLLLAMLGVYGTMAYSVAQRRFEIGIRIAFGAEQRGILRMVLMHACKLAGLGIVIGLVASLALTRLMTSMLVGVHAADPLNMIAAALLLLATAAGAALIPARRAASIQPMEALRTD
jgi:putative ABC transport system permease protein